MRVGSLDEIDPVLVTKEGFSQTKERAPRKFKRLGIAQSKVLGVSEGSSIQIEVV